MKWQKGFLRLGNEILLILQDKYFIKTYDFN